MICFPNAKINLGLHIVRKRRDGYHDIETLMYPVRGLFDGLEILPRADDRIEFTLSGLQVDGPPANNLCVKAYRLLQERYGLGGATLHLRKNIPFGAGLGGGSADASFLIVAVNQLYKLGLHPQEMEEMAARLGSDTPFFIRNRPALAAGRGEVLTPVDVDLTGYGLVLIKPDLHISTAEAYAGVTPCETARPLSDILNLPIKQWKERLKNDFETSLFPRYPQLSALKSLLYNAGAIYASLSGSGSTIFGMFKGEKIPDISAPNSFIGKYIL